jgi:simple sugar transport system ATP-binding protein
VLLISSELDELLEICYRIAVIYRGELVANFARPEADRETIGRFMLGGSALASVPA